MAKKKAEKMDSLSNAVPVPPGEDKWQTRDDVDTILKHQELRENPKRFGRAANRIKAAADRCCGRR